MDQKIEATVALADPGKQRRHLLVVRDVTRQDQRVDQRRAKLADVLFEALALIRQHERRPLRGRRLRDGPREGPLVGDTNDEAGLSSKRRSGHGRRRG